MAGMPKTGTVTYEEWLDMPEVQEGREEVVNGEIRTMPPNKSPHPEVMCALQVAFLRQLDLAETMFLASTFGLVVTREPLTCRSPDVAVFDRATIVRRHGYYHSAPQLVIEVLSPSESRKEVDEKLRDYESIGVEEVWLISPEAANVEILLLEEGQLRLTGILAEGILKPKHFPTVQINIAEIWPD
jgi:Uma2 family endonuclease